MAKKTVSNTQDNGGRKPDGTFADGNPGGPGRPRRSTETQYLVALLDVVTLDCWRAICEKAATDAKAGNHQAREWLAAYLVGQPSDNHRARRPSQAIALEEDGGIDLNELRNRMKFNRSIGVE